MHGRKKEFTTEEVRLARRQIEAKRIQEYRKLCDAMNDQRRNSVLTNESLSTTTSLLECNPEYYTAWNFRRCILSNLLGSEDEEEAGDKLLQQELLFSQSCIKLNPKSYWVWNHRQWILRTMKSPNWQLEVGLCNKFLDIDQRNFHCWDYRRFIISNMPPAVRQEFDYTKQKICQNFSNYSAWHYRASLLMKMISSGVDSQKLLEKEFDMVHNAIFTEPKDQSPWLYLKWLLSRVFDGPRVLGFESKYVESGYWLFTCYFDTAVRPSDNGNYSTLRCADKIHRLNWIPLIGARSHFSRAYYCYLVAPKQMPVEISFPRGLFIGSTDNRTSMAVEVKIESFGKVENVSPNSSWQRSIFENELAIINELLSEEPQAKYALLIRRWLEQQLGQASELDSESIIRADKLRRHFYQDAACLFDEDRVSDVTTLILPLNFSKLVHLNISGTKIRDISVVSQFIFLEHLDASDNDLVTLPVLRLPKLTFLALRHNQLRNINELEKLFVGDTLQELYISGTNLPYDLSRVQALFPALRKLDTHNLDVNHDVLFTYQMMKLACGLGWQSDPTPSAYCVGCVIVDDTSREIISTGYSREHPGNTHAEECALEKVPTSAGDLTMYVSMEPCSRRLSGNKPCVDRILKWGRVKRVVVATKEPAKFVADCTGCQQLVEHGIQVSYMPWFQRETMAANDHLHLPKDE